MVRTAEHTLPNKSVESPFGEKKYAISQAELLTQGKRWLFRGDWRRFANWRHAGCGSLFVAG